MRLLRWQLNPNPNPNPNHNPNPNPNPNPNWIFALCPIVIVDLVWGSITYHIIKPINFTLVVDNFGVKYSVKEHALRLKASLETKYKVTTDWEGKL